MPKTLLAWLRAVVLAILVGAAVPTDADSAGGAWLVSDAGEGPWQKINASCIEQSRLRGGDFDGDGKTDVFSTWEGKWRVSFGGTGQWKVINTSGVGVGDLRLGDFDGDGRTDVFRSGGGKWHVSFGGNTPWKTINSSGFGVSKLRFGDHDKNGTTDVFAKWGGSWRVSLNGTKPWEPINVSDPGAADLGVRGLEFGNYVGDERKDKFKSDTSSCIEGSEPCTVSVIIRNDRCLNVDGTPSTILEPGKTSAIGCGGSEEQARKRARVSFQQFACLSEANQPTPGCCTVTEEVVPGCLCR